MASPSDSDHLEVALLGCATSIVRRSSLALLDLLQTRFHCEPQILGLDLDSDLTKVARPGVLPEKRLEMALQPSGVKVSVWRADLANFSAAAVVNAANSKLQHHGGLALALSEAGGPQVQRESDDYVKIHGDVKTGDAVALGAGKLNCKMIIHAVGPHLRFRPNDHEVFAAKNQLESAVRSILQIVEKKQLETVAIPAISSGIFNFPVDKCADAIVSTVMRFYGSSTSHRFKPKEVLLVNNDDPTVKEMERACKKLLSPSAPASNSQAAATGSKPKPQPTASDVQTRGAKAKAAPPEVQLGSTRVVLRKGCLEEQKMDVIVNTIGSDRNLNAGLVSKTLLKKAGHEMQKEIYGAPFNGSLIITKGYGLDCKEVYHTCCPFKSTFGSDQILFKSVQDCLWFAVASKHRSIAFPAIGTGGLGFMDREVAQIMLNAVWNFAHTSPMPLDVHFVIFPSDSNRYKAFEAELNIFRPRAFHTEPTQSSAQAQALNTKPALPSSHEKGWEVAPQKAPTEPCIRLESSSYFGRIEAEAWLQGLLSNNYSSVIIRNNFTQLLGEKELEELSQTEVEGVQVEEFLDKGRSGLMVSGSREEDIAVTALKLQHMLQEVQRQYLKEEVEELKSVAQSKVQMERSRASRSDAPVKPFAKQLQKQMLNILKVERVDNSALEKVFRLQKAQMPSHSSEHLLQLVPAQFCDMVGHVGFRPECAPPDDSYLGEGLYFAEDVQTALSLWSDRSDQLLYLFVAEVLTGKSGSGKPGLVLAPGQDSRPGSDPGTRCESVKERGVTVVFNHDQALPKFIIICTKETLNSPV